jgi:putative membrane protein
MRTFILAMAAVVLCLPAVAADASPKATQDFIDKAAVANQFEIDTSQLALKYGKGDDVKKFAQEMIDDHTKIGEEFKATLTAANIQLPAEGLDLSHKAKYAKLRVFTTESGFDASYVAEQLAAHEEAVTLFKDHAANDPTPAIKEFAAKTLPKLEHHLEMAKALNTKYTQ